MFSKKATKIDEIFTVYLTSTKGKKFCPEYLGQNFSNFFVHILGNVTTLYFHSEISWPLCYVKMENKLQFITLPIFRNQIYQTWIRRYLPSWFPCLSAVAAFWLVTSTIGQSQIVDSKPVMFGLSVGFWVIFGGVVLVGKGVTTSILLSAWKIV